VRLFVGIELDRAVAAAAASLTDELRRRAQRMAPRARITWIPEERFHLTVRFIGNADDDAQRAIQRELEPPLGLAPFDISLLGTGAFPSSGRPQVLWVGLAAGLESLRQIETEVSRRLERAGVRREERPYGPHLTLARVRDAAGLRSRALFDGLEATPLGTSRVEAITLFESRLSPGGPTYLPLQRTPLGDR
jgi:2'-5' RNA ligase